MNTEKKSLLKQMLQPSRIYPVLVIAAMGIVFRCSQDGKKVFKTEITGQTMGTITYQVKYLSNNTNDYKAKIDDLLKRFNESLSTYIPHSEISTFNQSDSFAFVSPFFFPVLEASKIVFEETKGAFDPTVMPLVKAWRFGPDKDKMTDPALVNVDSILAFVGFEKIYFDEKIIRKKTKGVQLDLSAIAKGYAVDLVGKLLESQGVESYMVEIGGEIMTKGKNEKDQAWTLGIRNPLYKLNGGAELFATVSLSGRAMATSGNYENFYQKDGQKYVHTINPQTGRPFENNLLSVSVFAPNCMLADAFATAFMVMGVEKTIAYIKSQESIDVFLIYDQQGQIQTYQSAGIEINEVKVGQ